MRYRKIRTIKNSKVGNISCSEEQLISAYTRHMFKIVVLLMLLKLFAVLFVRQCYWNGNKYYLVSSSKRFYLGSDILSDKASHTNKHLCQISFSNDIWFLSQTKLKFWWYLYITCCRQKMSELLLSNSSLQ